MQHTVKIIYISLIMLIFSNSIQAQGGTMYTSFRNLTVSGDTWTFDLYDSVGTDYVGPDQNDWQGIQVRMDLTLPAGVTVVGGVGIGDATYTTGTAGVQTGFSGTPGPAGTTKMAVNVSRLSQRDLTPLALAVKIASYTVTFSGPVTGTEPGVPRPTSSSGPSAWSNSSSNPTLGFKRNLTQPSFTLPITLVSFDATKSGAAVNLNWVVSSEINAKGYDVERSGNGTKFTAINHVAATGSSNYSSTDANPLTGANYYRLKMVDIDGQFKYSKVVRVNYDGKPSPITVLPNPVIDNAKVFGLTGKNKITVIDASGRQLATYATTSTSQSISMGGFAAGIYTLLVTATDGSFTSLKVIKQ